MTIYDKKSTQTSIKGEVEVYSVRNGVWEFLFRKSNLITYQGHGILASAVAGMSPLNGMYFVFENNSGALKITADVSNDGNTYTNPASDRSFVRVSTMGGPVITTSGTDYELNKVSFLAVTDSSSFFPSIPVTDGTSVFYHAALVNIPDIDDQAQDRIFSCFDFPTTFTKIAGAQLGIKWDVTFTL